MPALYAHYHFGNAALEDLSSDLKELINTHRELFDIGVQGPDIFFYYHPLKNNPVARYGNQMHDAKAAAFFAPLKNILSENIKDAAAISAYLLGFTCHYAFDTLAHPYIAKKIIVSHVSHYAIESDYDRYLMVKDGHFNSCLEQIHPTLENAKIIQKCFPQFSVSVILDAIKGIKDYNRLLLAPGVLKRTILGSIMKMLPIKDFADHLITTKENPLCRDSNLRLDKIQAQALKLYIKLSENLMTYLHGETDLSNLFDHTFDEKDDIDDIPVYEDLNKERNYVI